MFQQLYRAVPVDEVPIGSVTNGVHGRTWVSSAMNDLFSKYINPSWEDAGPADWARIAEARDDELWRAREQGKEALIGFVRSQLKSSLVEKGAVPTRRRLGRRSPGPHPPHHRFRPPVRLLQAGHAPALPARPAEGAAPRPQAARPARIRRQGPPGGRPRQGDDPPDRPVRPGPGGPPPDRLHRGLRHRRGPDPAPGLRRLAQQPPPPDGGQRHQRPEGGPQRCPQPVGARRLVGRDVRRQERLADRLGRDLHRPPAARRGRGQQPLRDPGAPGRAALLRPGRRPLPPPMGGPHQGLAQLSRASGPGVADGAGLHQADVRADGQAGRRRSAPTASPGPRRWRTGRPTWSGPGTRWRSCPSTSTRRPW